MTKKLLNNVRYKKEAKKTWKQVAQRTRATTSKHTGMGIGRKSLSGVESRAEDQQEMFLQTLKQPKIAYRKYGALAE